jgi:RNA polymerase sigma-70 factor (ECF subfamily)
MTRAAQTAARPNPPAAVEWRPAYAVEFGTLILPGTGTDPAAASMDNDTARELLRRVAARDEAAFATLHRALARRVFAFAMRGLRDEGRAEEIVVDTLFEVWKRPERYDGTSLVSTWVLGIARNKTLTLARSLRSNEPLSDEMADTLASGDPGAFEAIAEGQREAGVRNCMEKLSAPHRECMHLVFYEGMALADVAGIQNCPENTVKTRLFHARKNIEHCLRRLLEREGDLEGAGHV